MTALTKDVARDAKDSKLVSLPIAANAIIFRGALVKINAAGYVEPCSSEAGAVFAGVSRESMDNTGGSNGEQLMQIESRDAFYVAAVGMGADDLGKKVYALDDNTAQLAAGTNLQEAGKIIEVVSATKVLVLPNANLTK